MTAIYVALVIYMVVLFGVGLFYSKKTPPSTTFCWLAATLASQPPP